MANDDTPERLKISVGGQDLYLAPESEGQARVAAALPTTPSEDMRHALGQLSIPREDHRPEADRDYLPNAATEWVVSVEVDGGRELLARAVDIRFDREWRRAHGGVTIYGLNPKTDRWTFLISADGPETVTRIQVAWRFVEPGASEAPPSREVWSSRLRAVSQAVAPLGVARVWSSMPPAEAADRGRQLAEVQSAGDMAVTLVLAAPRAAGFEGREIWDVMLCLGLQWGDMDCFHWRNPGDEGDDALFSVWTRTPPGYFLPEEVAAGRVQTQDLVFGFSVPRCHRPVDVFDAMARAMLYAQQRLGGEILDMSGKPADHASVRAEIEATVRQLVSWGFDPGSESALYLF